ncbi:MAG: GDP-mannose 4,6-dehydratase [archaeon]
MKGVVLAAGLGKRLRPLTLNKPKALVEINGKPLLWYSVQKLKRAGIREICIVTGRYGEKIRAYFGDGSKFGVRITYARQPKPLGIAHALSYAKSFVGESPFVLLLSDNIFQDSIKRLKVEHEKSGAVSSIVLKEVDNPKELGVAEIQKGRIKRLVEKPSVPPSNLAITGIYFFSGPDVFRFIGRLKPSKRGEYEITDTLQMMVSAGKRINPIRITGWWKDTGNFIDLDIAEALLRGGTAVVTGGAGFIGSFLCEMLLDDGLKVVCVDNLSTGRKKNIRHLLRNKNFEFVKHDVKEKFDYPGTVDYVFHMASRASPVDFYKYPIDIMLTNSVGTLNFLELARKKGARFLEASTSEVYGEPLQHPQREEYWGNVNSIGVRSCYDEGKRFSEALVKSYERKYGLDVRIVRIFNTYGPRMQKDDGRLIPNIVNQALTNKPITIYGKGTQTRSFCYVTDLVDGIKRLMYSRYSGEVFNMGNCDEFSVKNVALMVKKMTKSKSRLMYRPLPENDPTKRQPDVSKAKEMLNWIPTVPLEKGLGRTLEYFKK